MDNKLNEQNNFIMYTTDDGQVDIEVRLEDENVWLTQNSMAELFDTTKQNISLHIKNIFEEKELDGFLTMTHKDILEGVGTISHEKALEKAHKEYDKYMKSHLTQAEKDYLEIMGEDIKKLK